MHQIYLYCLIKGFYTADVRLAFLVEIFEPLVELVKAHTYYFQTLEPGNTRTTSLKMCIDALITKYGADIFPKELNACYLDFLNKAVKSRVRIMHIKKNQEAKCFSDKEDIYYSAKFSLLYRRILLELLGISYCSYEAQLKDAVISWDDWLSGECN